MATILSSIDSLAGSESSLPATEAGSLRPTICQVLHSLAVGGTEVLAARLARQMGNRYRYVFACLDELGTLGEELRDEGFTIEVVGRRPGIDFDCFRRLRGFWRNEHVDLVHAHQYTPFFYALAARGMHRGPRVLFTEHGRFLPDYPRRKRILFNRVMLRPSDHVVAVGGAVRQALIDNEGIPAKRIEVIYNGVDLSRFDSASCERSAVRAELGIAPDALVLAMVARLDYLKDHATAIRTIQRVSAERKDVHLLVIGEGPERKKIEDEIEACAVQRHIHMLGLRGDIARLLAASDQFLLTSISEGIPVTLIEAMAARLPIVSTDVGGVGEVIQDDRTGLLAPSGEDKDLADAVLRLAGDPALVSRITEAAHQRAEDVFSEKRMHAAYAADYDRMIDPAKCQRR